MTERDGSSGRASSRPRAQERYKAWPGLQNPRSAEATKVAREVWITRCHQDRAWRWLHIGAYRAYRTVRAVIRGMADEFTAAPKRTLLEIALGLPIAMLSIDPYREWLLRWKHAWHAILA